VPLRAPNFSVYLNGTRLSSQYVAGKKIPFLEGTKFGTVYGEIVLVTSGSSPREKAGIQCKVKGVTIKERGNHQAGFLWTGKFRFTG